MEKNLGKLTAVDLREYWNNEATDFTPWLARPENVALLGEAVGFELEVEHTEVAIGPYSADIVAKTSGLASMWLLKTSLVNPIMITSESY